MRQSYVGLANHIADAAQQQNATWPLFRIPNYELHAGQVRIQSGSELIGCSYILEPYNEEKYLEFVTDNYEDSLRDGHLTRYGNLDRLQRIGYTPNFTMIGPNGFALDKIERPMRSVSWEVSPPPSTYRSINFDFFNTLPDIEEMIIAIKALKNETISTNFQQYLDIEGLTKEEHNAMHSTRSNSDANFPHSFIGAPVYEIPNDYNSKFVAFVYGGYAWDYTLRFLLPSNVKGIVVEIRNSCNQVGVFELVRSDAFYLGENATHESMYDEMEVV